MVADDRRDAVSPRVISLPDGALADALVGGLLVLDTEGIVRAANVSAQRLLAQPEDALVGRPIVAALPVTTRRGDRPLAAEKHPALVALRSGEAQQRAALRVNRPDGASRWFAVDAVPIRDAGRVAHVVVTFNDVTVRREGDERLRLLESVVVTANDAVLITEAEPIDLPGPRIIYVNDAFTRMTGYRVLSTKVGRAGQLGNEGVLKQGGAAGQAMAEVPVTARQVAKRSSRCWR